MARVEMSRLNLRARSSSSHESTVPRKSEHTWAAAVSASGTAMPIVFCGWRARAARKSRSESKLCLARRETLCLTMCTLASPAQPSTA